ncbi:MAG: hypothetical protein A2147_04565 [Chloroflexi bacterium RBG_16_57_8]|nr:MAG: hypothetical protein A2147_04565 [Chloroflexi bacterium RBG_16_57_8]
MNTLQKRRLELVGTIRWLHQEFESLVALADANVTAVPIATYRSNPRRRTARNGKTVPEQYA